MQSDIEKREQELLVAIRDYRLAARSGTDAALSLARARLRAALIYAGVSPSCLMDP